MDANLTSILQVALQQGIWAALYIYETPEIRHTVITFDCNAEIDDKTLANNHGHYSAEFTKKQYARSIPSQRERAREKADEFISSIL